MASLNERILSIATRSKELKTELELIQQAPATYQESSREVEKLNKTVSRNESLLELIERESKEKREAMQKLRDSRFRKLTNKNFDADLKDAEDKYQAIAKEETQAQEQLKTTRAQLEKISKENDCNGTSARRYGDIAEKLDALYDSVFAGPIPEHPEEDEQERVVAEAKGVCDDIYGGCGAEKRVIEYLSQALEAMIGAVRKMNMVSTLINQSNVNAIMDLGGGNAASFEAQKTMKANVIGSKQQFQEAVRLVQQAQQASPGVKDMKNMDLVTEIFKDHQFINFIVQESAWEKAAGVAQAQARLKMQLEAAKIRKEKLDTDFVEAMLALESENMHLRRIRQSIIDQVAAEQSFPPSYTAL